MKNTKIIAIDFDGTLTTENTWPEIGEPNETVLALARYYRAKGYELILWTCRDGVRLDEAVEWCRNREVTFDAVNDNLDRVKEEYGMNARKVYADVYIDDKSVNPDMIALLEI